MHFPHKKSPNNSSRSFLGICCKMFSARGNFNTHLACCHTPHLSHPTQRPVKFGSSSRAPHTQFTFMGSSSSSSPFSSSGCSSWHFEHTNSPNNLSRSSFDIRCKLRSCIFVILNTHLACCHTPHLSHPNQRPVKFGSSSRAPHTQFTFKAPPGSSLFASIFTGASAGNSTTLTSSTRFSSTATSAGAAGTSRRWNASGNASGALSALFVFAGDVMGVTNGGVSVGVARPSRAFSNASPSSTTASSASAAAISCASFSPRLAVTSIMISTVFPSPISSAKMPPRTSS
mmetsp:Transcript_5781/g.20923  ORF Transcript_5781/g.20923 Transcript_5781/m.20923 type:complete len:287 (-) Transcript_5781:1034-1894(-)